MVQTSGEAVYAFDRSLSPNQLHGAFILSEIGKIILIQLLIFYILSLIHLFKANCRIDKIDTSAAINMPGVVKILFAKDIPGPNSFVPPSVYPEKLFCDDYIDYAGQALGLVVAETFQQALTAASKVKVTYKEIKPPVLTIQDAIKNNSFFPDPPNHDFVVGNAEQAINASPFKISNDFSMGSQYHYHMEHHVATCEPYENYFK